MNKSFTREEIFKTMLDSDVSKIFEMIDEFDVSSTDHFSISVWRFCRIILEVAAIMPDDKIEDKDALVFGIIQRMAQHTNIFNLTSFVLGIFSPDEKHDLDLVPSRIQKALSRNIFSEDIAEDIRGLDKAAAMSLISYMHTDDVEQLSYPFSPPIMECVYRQGLISYRSLFSLMCYCLRDPDCYTCQMRFFCESMK